MQKKTQKKTVVTSALPYANGPLHIGHMVEYIQTDIFVRFLRLTREKAIYCCADDTHGTPIEIAAMKKGIPPTYLINQMHEEHLKDFNEFLISFDSYHSTNSEENKRFSDLIFTRLRENGLIYKKKVELIYCPKCNRFLPDRYVKGKCPKCGADDQYGDVCEKCNATYSTTDLAEPYCAICGSPPTTRSSEHYFFRLSSCADDLREWLNSNRNLQPEVRNYVLGWIKEGLRDWDITRDGPYFGFNIPGEKDLYYYVWLDAPVGYISSTENYCRNIMKGKEKVEDYWKHGRIIHFIGKDIIYFHFLFWPAMLMNSGFSLPEDIVVHGFLTVNKEKMSKSRGTFFTARDYLKALDPEYLRFYYASNLTKSEGDIDLDFEDFRSSINNKLVADLGNFTYRVVSFAEKNLGSETEAFSEPELEEKLRQKYDEIKEAYRSYNFRRAVSLILEAGSVGNKYFQDNKPWELAKKEKDSDEWKRMKEVVSFCVNLVKEISILIKPVLPRFSAGIEKQLNLEEQSWDCLGKKLESRKLGKAEILISKIGDELESIAVKDPLALLDLRTARVVEARKHPDADKLLIMQVDIGSEKRQIVAGLAGHYSPEEIEGKNIVIVKNLRPAKLKGETSAGMLLAGDDRRNVRILESDEEPGASVFVNGIEPQPDKEVGIDDFNKVKLTISHGRVYYKGEPLRAGKSEVRVDLEKGKVS